MPLVDVPEFAKISKILFGMNYCVTLRLYGPIVADLSLADGLSTEFGGGVETKKVVSSDWPSAIAIIRRRLGYPGGDGHGPDNIDEKIPIIDHAVAAVVNRYSFTDCKIVTRFLFKKGHPDRPIFWSFAYDLHGEKGRYIWIGSSSD